MEASSVFQLKETTITKRGFTTSETTSRLLWVLWLLEHHGGGCQMLCALELGITGMKMWNTFAWGGSCPTESQL